MVHLQPNWIRLFSGCNRLAIRILNKRAFVAKAKQSLAPFTVTKSRKRDRFDVAENDTITIVVLLR